MNPRLRLLWLGLLVAASATLTAVYTCITPFAAFGVLAATTLSRRDGLLLMIVLWLANQAVGFGVLGYPWRADTLGWGVAIGGAALIGTLAAQWAVERSGSSRSLGQTVAAFLSAFVGYQLGLYALAVPFLSVAGAFAPSIIGQVLAVNVGALIGLVGVSQLLAAVEGLLHRRRVQTSPARFA